MKRFVAATWLSIVLAACAHRAAAPVVPATPVEIEDVVVMAEPDPLTNLSSFDAEQLFHIAREEERKEAWERARKLYERLLSFFPDSGYRDAAAFNLGLIHEEAKRWEDAERSYRLIADQPVPAIDQGRRTWLDAHFRLSVVLGNANKWWHAVGVFDELLGHEWLSEVDRLEAMVGRGIGIHEAGEPESAEIAFSHVLRFYRLAEREGFRDTRGLVAEAAFRMGDIARERYSSIELQFPVDVLRTRLEEKCVELLSAQHRYLRALRYGDASTVAAAGFRIGGLYEALHSAVTGLEAPLELDEDQAQVYHELVRERVRVLLEKALKTYEKALLIGRRSPHAEVWTTRLEDAIDRLRRLYLEETGA